MVFVSISAFRGRSEKLWLPCGTSRARIDDKIGQPGNTCFPLRHDDYKHTPLWIVQSSVRGVSLGLELFGGSTCHRLDLQRKPKLAAMLGPLKCSLQWVGLVIDFLPQHINVPLQHLRTDTLSTICGAEVAVDAGRPVATTARKAS